MLKCNYFKYYLFIYYVLFRKGICNVRRGININTYARHCTLDGDDRMLVFGASRRHYTTRRLHNDRAHGAYTAAYASYPYATHIHRRLTHNRAHIAYTDAYGIVARPAGVHEPAGVHTPACVMPPLTGLGGQRSGASGHC